MSFLSDWEPTITATAGVATLAVAGMLLTKIGPWYFSLRKPSWKPPDWLFGPAWTTIFVLEAISAVRGWHAAHDALAAGFMIGAYVLNGLLNMLWSFLFFTMRRPDYAMREVGLLWLSIVLMMVSLPPGTGLTWMLLLPYLLWVSFASYLNYTIVRLNAPFAVPA